jgi:hypothetical protein
MQLLMKNRTRYYGRGFCGNVEMECIVKSALTSSVEYRLINSHNKQFLHNFIFPSTGLSKRPTPSGRGGVITRR